MQELERSTCGDRGGAYRVLVRKSKGNTHLEELGVDGRVILKLIFKTQNTMAWTGLILLKIG